MDEKVIDWFRKTGYPFELWAEAVLSECGFRTTSSSLYQDEETDATREIDLETELSLWSKDSKVNLNIRLLIECKKSDKPFILLRNSRKRKAEISLPEYVSPEDVAMGLFAENSNSTFKLPGQSGTGFKLIQAFATSDEVPYKAVHSLIKCYNYFKAEEEKLIKYYIEDNVHSFLIPILLVDAPLLELTVENNYKHLVRDLDCGMLFTLSKYVKYIPREFDLPIVTKNNFETFLKSLIRAAKANLNFLVENPKVNVKHVMGSHRETNSESNNHA